MAHGALSNTGIKSASFCFTGSSYQVETRARAITFDINLSEADAAYSKRSMSRLSSAIEPPRTHGRGHEGLLSWPENFFESRQHHSNSEVERQPANLLAKAMELSIYGSTVSRMLILLFKISSNRSTITSSSNSLEDIKNILSPSS